MDAAIAVSNDNEDPRPPALLRGTARGLEIHVIGSAGIEPIVEAVTLRLEEAPSFFRGSDVRIRVESGPLPAGCLGRLDELAGKYDLRIVEVGAPPKKTKPAAEGDAVPQPNLAAGSAPAPQVAAAAPADDEPLEAFEDAPTGLGPNPIVTAPPVEPVLVAEPVVLADAELTQMMQALAASPPPASITATAPEAEVTPGPRLFIGPVRSGVILDHQGHLIVFGDVNPGAEVRATGNIVVLGRLRGTAHAGIGQDVGFILALRLEPQQLRVGRKVARAADSDTPANEAEIAYCTGDQIVVERYLGKLPRNLATSI